MRAFGAAIAIALLAAGCSDNAEPTASTPTTTALPTFSMTTTSAAPTTTLPPLEPLALVAMPPPAGLESAATFYDGIAYDTHDATVVDLALPFTAQLTDVTEPVPVVIYVHGGGFVEGDRTRAYEPARVHEANEFLAAGYAFASVDYRLLDAPTAAGILTSLHDSRRAVQFLRAHATQLGLDPTRVLLTGGSAGAGTALWIAMSDDAAEPTNVDPVERASTRVSGVIALETQATYDILRWGPDVFDNEELDVLAEAAAFDYDDVFLRYYDLDNADEMTSPQTAKYRQAVDILRLINAGDPPFWAHSGAQPADPPWKPAYLLHAPQHLVALQAQAEAAGVESVIFAPVLDIADPSGETALEFAQRLLG